MNAGKEWGLTRIESSEVDGIIYLVAHSVACYSALFTALQEDPEGGHGSGVPGGLRSGVH